MQATASCADSIRPVARTPATHDGERVSPGRAEDQDRNEGQGAEEIDGADKIRPFEAAAGGGTPRRTRRRAPRSRRATSRGIRAGVGSLAQRLTMPSPAPKKRYQEGPPRHGQVQDRCQCAQGAARTSHLYSHPASPAREQNARQGPVPPAPHRIPTITGDRQHGQRGEKAAMAGHPTRPKRRMRSPATIRERLGLPRSRANPVQNHKRRSQRVEAGASAQGGPSSSPAAMARAVVVASSIDGSARAAAQPGTRRRSADQRSSTGTFSASADKRIVRGWRPRTCADDNQTDRTSTVGQGHGPRAPAKREERTRK